ncbi:metallophosphoesterase family protein [Rhodopila sp.]|uniref:metallophosphoesterase family protein n=1 Tax=Rhodopila sp. TaxID=2480087 RepID=UPI003D0E438E
MTSDIVLVHSSDLHVDDDPHQGPHGEDGATGLRVVLATAKTLRADYVLLVGDVFDSNRQSPAIIEQCVALLNEVGRPVIVLPGNHDPVTTDSVWLRGGLNHLPHVHIIGVTHGLTVHFPSHDLQIWGHAHVDYGNMVPLRDPPARTARWHVTLAHGHYEDDGVPPLRPSWLISNAEIEATRADYLALGHWNRAAQVGTGTTVPAYYSGSPDLAKTVNVVRLRGHGTVVVTREGIDWGPAETFPN